MNTTCKAIALAIPLALGLFTIPAHNEEQRTNTGTTLNNVVPSGCGVAIELPQSLVKGAASLPLKVTGTAGDQAATLSLRIISGGNKIGGTLWLDTAATVPADELDWPVPAGSSRTETLFIKGVDISSVVSDVKLQAAMSCGKTATDSTTVVRPCSLLAEPKFPKNPHKWFYAAKVEVAGDKVPGGVKYKVTWMPPDATGVYDQGGSIHPNLKDFPGTVFPGAVTTYHVGPSSSRIWVSKSFVCKYTDPCEWGAQKASDSTIGWALLGRDGPILNGGNGDDGGKGGDVPEFPPPPPPDDTGDGGDDGDGGDGDGWPLVGPPWWERYSAECAYPTADARVPVDLPPADGIEIVGEEIGNSAILLGFANGNNESERRFLTATGTASFTSSVRGVLAESTGTVKHCGMTGEIRVESHTGTSGLDPFIWIDEIAPDGWDITANTETSHGGDLSWEEWNEEHAVWETLTYRFQWSLSDENTTLMLKQDAMGRSWKFRDIYDVQRSAYWGAWSVSGGNSFSYAKLRYKLRVPEGWSRPVRVSWVEQYHPTDPWFNEQAPRPGEEWVVKTAVIPAGMDETECYEIDPAQMDGKEGYWHVFLLDIEDASLAYDAASKEMFSVAGGIPDSGRMPALGISVTNAVRVGGRYRVSVAVDYEDPHGDIPGTPANDIVLFLVDGVVVGEVGSLSNDVGGEVDSPWKAKNSRRTLTYEFDIPPKQGITTLTAKTISGDGVEAATASTGIVLDLLPEGTQAPVSHKPALTTGASFGSSQADEMDITFPGGAPATLTETGPDTLVFAGQAVIAGETKAVSVKVDSHEPEQAGTIMATMEIGTPADTYEISACQAADGQQYETLSIHRVIVSPPSELPTIHLSAVPNPTVADTLGVAFPGGPLATLMETGVDSGVFAGEAVVGGSPCQTKVVFSGIQRPIASAPALLFATVDLQTGGAHYVESVETAAGSGEYGVAYSRPLATPATSAVAVADTRATPPVLTGSCPFMLRFEVPGFLAEQIENGEVGIWLDDHRMVGGTNGYLAPGEAPNVARPLVCIMDGSGPEVFTWSRSGTEVTSSPAGIISGDSFEVTFRNEDGETLWSNTYSLESQVPEPLGDEFPEPPFEEQVAGWYLVCFGHFGQAVLNSFQELGGTINYWYSPNGVKQTSQLSWDAGLKPYIDVDRRQEPFAAAVAQYKLLAEAFYPTAGIRCQALSHAWWELRMPPLHLKDEEGEEMKWRMQWAREFTKVCGEQLQEFANWAENGVRITVTPVDIVVSICEAGNHFRNREWGQGGLTLASATPYVGKMAAAVGKPLVIKLGQKALIKGGLALTVGTVRQVTKLVKNMASSGRARVMAMRDLRQMLESGEIGRGYLENLYDTGQLKFKTDIVATAFNRIYHSQYKVLTAGIEARTLTKKIKDQIAHHDLPLQLEREFLIRGIDPNDGLEAGTFVDKLYHRHILHNRSMVTGLGADPGGAWNYQWKRYFEKNPGASVADIKEFNNLLWERVRAVAPDPGLPIEEKVAKELFTKIKWPFNEGIP